MLNSGGYFRTKNIYKLEQAKVSLKFSRVQYHLYTSFIHHSFGYLGQTVKNFPKL